MTFEQAKAFLKNHSEEIGRQVSEGDPLCVSIALLLELHLEEPSNRDVVGVLTLAIEEYQQIFHSGLGITPSRPRLLH